MLRAPRRQRSERSVSIFEIGDETKRSIVLLGGEENGTLPLFASGCVERRPCPRQTLSDIDAANGAAFELLVDDLAFVPCAKP